MKRWIAFAALCVVQGLAWIPLEHSAIGITGASCAVGALLAAIGLMWVKPSARVSVVGVCCVLVGPWLCLLLGGNAPGSGAVALALVLVPVVIAVAQPALSEEGFSPEKLWPGLAAAAGLLLIAPAPNLSDWRVDAVLCLVPLVTGVGCVLLKRGEGWTSNRAVALCIAAALFLLLTLPQTGVRHMLSGISVVPVIVCALVFGLELLALHSLSATRYSAQFTIVPLLVLLEGPSALSAGVLSWRFGACALLLGFASLMLLRDGSEEKLA